MRSRDRVFMGSEPFSQGHGPRPTEVPRQASAGLRQTESPISASSPSSSSSSGSNFSADLLLEIERLRAERDAMAAELQIERAERLRAEERLRLFEREKLEQMREGAATREKLASELEESRLRAMRAEARQAAIEADLRLEEIASRRRGNYPPAEAEPGTSAGEIAEPGREEPTAASEPEPQPEPVAEPPKFVRPNQARYTPANSVSKYSRVARGAARGEAPTATPGARMGRSDESAAAEVPPADRGSDPIGAVRGQTRMSDVEPPKWPSSGPAGPAGPAKNGPFSAAKLTPGPGTAGARGGAAAGRPSLDRAHLEARLDAGAPIEVTARFRQFQPVTQSHIKVCDWLAKANTLDEIDHLAAGELARSEIVTVLTLFFERSFLVFKS